MIYALDINPTTFPPAQFDKISSIVNLIVPVIMSTVGIIFLIMLFYGSFTWTTAGGDPEKVKKAQKTLKFALIGLFIVIGAYIGVKLIQMFFGLPNIFS